jgi:hypothetical protein
MVIKYGGRRKEALFRGAGEDLSAFSFRGPNMAMLVIM